MAPFHLLPISSSSSPITTSFLSTRTVASLFYFATLMFFFSSTFYESMTVESLWFTLFLFVLFGIGLLPLPRLKLQDRVKNNFYYAVCKSMGSFWCNYIFNWIGSTLKLETDNFLMKASLAFLFFLIAIDHMYDIDEDIQVCDGYLFAGFSLMSQQKIISQWLIVCIGSSVCVLKNYLELSRSLGGDSQANDRDDVSLSAEKKKAARTVAKVFYFVTVVFFSCSVFYDSLPMEKVWYPFMFFLACAIPLFPLGPLKLKKKMKSVFLYAIFKSVGSFGCYYFFNWLGSSINLGTDTYMMNASLTFLFFLIAIDNVCEIDEHVELCDGYLYAGYGLMTAQNHIPQWLVVCIGPAVSLLKNYLQVSRKVQWSSGNIKSEGSIIEVEKKNIEQRRHGAETSEDQTGAEETSEDQTGAEETSEDQTGAEETSEDQTGAEVSEWDNMTSRLVNILNSVEDYDF